jgi:2-C-methyl-D-erythritol 4-phosphate cytidylyltransferase
VTVRRTIPREELWRAQTPQAFPRVLLERAHVELAEFPATDDAQLLEELGHPVVLVPDLSSNIKITTLEDLEIAEALLHLRPASRQPARS